MASEPLKGYCSVYELSKTGFSDEKVLEFVPKAAEEGKKEKWRASGINHEDWNRLFAMYYGKHKIDQNPFVKRPIENRIRKAIEGQRYVMVSHMPVPEFIANDTENDQEDASMLSDLMQFVVDKSNYREAYYSRINNLLIFGTGILKVYWNPTAFNGFGMVEYAAQDPRTVFVNPGARSFDESTYLMSVGFVDYDELLSNYPDKSDEIMAAVQVANNEASGRGIFSFFRQYFKDQNQVPYSAGSGKDLIYDDSRSIEIIETYAQIPNSEEFANLKEDAKENEASGSIDTGLQSEVEAEDKRNPSKIRVFTVIGGKIVVYNDWLPFSHGMIPYVSSQNRYFGDRVWGVAEGETVESLQQELDRMADKRSAYNEISYFPWLKNPQGSNVPNDAFLQRPNAIINPNPEMSDKITYMSPPAIGRHIQSRRGEIIQEIDDELGSFTISSDVLQRNVQPTTISQVREVGEAPVRMKFELMKPADVKVAFMSVALTQQYFPMDMMLRVLDEEGSASSKKLPISVIRNIKNINNTRFDVKTGIAPEVPLSRVAAFQEAIAVINAGSFNPDMPIEARIALIELSSFPNKRKIVSGMIKADKEKKAAEKAALQAEMAAKKAPKGQPAPGGNMGATPNVDSEDPAEVEAALRQNPDLLDKMMGGVGRAQ